MNPECVRMETWFHDRCRGVQSELDPAGRLHLEICLPCRRLWESLAQPPDSAPLPGPLSEAIAARLAGSLAPVRPLPAPAVRTVSILLVLAVAALPGVNFLNYAGIPALTFGQLVLPTVWLIAVAVGAALCLSAQMEPGSRRLFPTAGLIWIATAGFVVGSVLLFRWTADDPHPWVRGSVCTLYGVGLAMPSSLAFWLLVRRAVFSPLSIAVSIGFLVGLTGFTVLLYGCQYTDAFHQLWHAAIPLIGGGLGYLVGAGALVLDRL